MLSFGLGTLPAVMGAGLFTGLLASLARAKHMRQVAGVSIVVMALLSLLWPGHESAEHHHDIEFHQVEDGALK